MMSSVRARQIVDAWTMFEQLAPLDPRVDEFLLNRAILRTKLVTGNARGDKEQLEAAAHDYETVIDRLDGLSAFGYRKHLAWGNLAETYMMLDRIDDSIPAYIQAMNSPAPTSTAMSTAYGLAVALDRAERRQNAVDVILAQGPKARFDFRNAIADHSVFYVPEGEAYYYFGLVEEAFGNDAEALRSWRAYIASGAHPEYQPRAKEHIKQLLAHPHPKIEPPEDPSWMIR
jgi:tetratricopeptide (TPR) repeat protein